MIRSELPSAPCSSSTFRRPRTCGLAKKTVGPILSRVNAIAGRLPRLHDQALSGRQGKDLDSLLLGEHVPGALLMDMRRPAVIIEQDQSARQQLRPEPFGGGDLRL